MVDDGDGEFDLDFFGEDAEETKEIAGGRRLAGVRLRGLSAGSAPPEVLRRRRWIALAVAAGIVLLVVVGVVTNGGSGGPAAAERGYVSTLTPVASDSGSIGRSLQGLLGGLETGGTSSSQALAALNGLIRRARGDLARAGQIRPPLLLGSVQAQVASALGLRVAGLERLRQALSRAFAATSAGTFAPVVSAALDRLVASDVIWRDLVVTPLGAQLAHDGIKGVTPPRSQLIANTNETSPTAIGALLQPAASSGPVLRVGDHGPAVVAWQTLLNQWLHLSAPTKPSLVTDGGFGPATLTATQALQRAQKLTPDGIVGPATRHALQHALAR